MSMIRPVRQRTMVEMVRTRGRNTASTTREGEMQIIKPPRGLLGINKPGQGRAGKLREDQSFLHSIVKLLK